MDPQQSMNIGVAGLVAIAVSGVFNAWGAWITYLKWREELRAGRALLQAENKRLRRRIRRMKARKKKQGEAHDRDTGSSDGDRPRPDPG
jgi:hypothetical protein